MSLTTCRFYEQQYPEIDSYVMVTVVEVAEMGAYVKLLEYDNIDGMILLSELSRRRIRSIQKLVRVGKDEVVRVLRVDKTKGYIDLSKRQVTHEDIERVQVRFRKAKTVASIMRHVAEQTQTPLEELYTAIVWPLERKYKTSYDAFSSSLSKPEVWQPVTFPSEKIREVLNTMIQRQLKPAPIKFRAQVEVTCFGPDGIDGVKEALRVAKTENSDEGKLEVNLIASPLYKLDFQCLDKNTGLEMLQRACQRVEEKIIACGGEFKMPMPPKAVTERDDAALEAMIETAEKETRQVAGDEPDSDSDIGSVHSGKM